MESDVFLVSSLIIGDVLADDYRVMEIQEEKGNVFEVVIENKWQTKRLRLDGDDFMQVDHPAKRNN